MQNWSSTIPLKQHINEHIVTICYRLQEAGFQAYIVGGATRDLIRNVKQHDWDITTDATPHEIKEVFKDYHIINTGIKYGTITLHRIRHNLIVLHGEQQLFDVGAEITTFRSDGSYSDGRRPDTVTFSKSIEEDLARRDFTINAIAYDPIADKIVDPYNGCDDIVRHIIRCVESNERFRRCITYA